MSIIRVLILLLCFICLSAIVTAQVTCENIGTDCETCKNTTGCAFCTSSNAVGCVSSLTGLFCELTGGILNDCDAQGTRCSYYGSCSDCLGDSGCGFCFSSGRAACMNVTASALCDQLGGEWYDETCPATTGTTGSSSTGPNGNAYAIPDPTSKCEEYDLNLPTCLGTVFYNVYVNSTYSQQNMATGAASMAQYSQFAGIPARCRNAGFALNCGSYFQKCEKIPTTSISVSIPPCKSVCEKFNEDCKEIIEMIAPGLRQNCDAIDSRTGTPRYPESSISYFYNNRIYDFQCNSMVPSANDVGYYPNRLQNAHFEVVHENLTAENWENLNATSLYTIANDTVFGSPSKALELSTSVGGIVGALQEVVFDRVNTLPVRISALSKAVGVTGDRGEGYSIVAHITYNDQTTQRELLAFVPGDHDYQLERYEFNPTKPIHKVRVVVQLSDRNGTAYFDYVALQEKIPESNLELKCFAPLALNMESAEAGGPACTLTCPLRTWDSQVAFDAIRPMQIVLSWISFILSSFMILTWVVFPHKRRYPDRLVLFFSIGAWLVAFQGVVQTFVSFKEATCKNDFEYHSGFNSSFCLFIAIILQLGASTLLMWWFCIAITTYLMIRNHVRQIDPKRTEKYLHLFVWSYVIITTVIPLAAGKMGGMEAGGCWIISVNDSWWQLSLLYIPFGVCLFIASILIGHACYIIYEVTRSVKGGSSSQSKRLRTYLRFIGFLFMAGVNFLIFWSYKFHAMAKKDFWTEEIQKEIICQANGGTEQECRGERASASAIAAAYFAFSFEGCLLFLFFGTSKKIYLLWYELFRSGTLPKTLPTSGTSDSEQRDSKRRSNRKTAVISIEETGDVQMSQYGSDKTASSN